MQERAKMLIINADYAVLWRWNEIPRTNKTMIIVSRKLKNYGKITHRSHKEINYYNVLFVNGLCSNWFCCMGLQQFNVILPGIIKMKPQLGKNIKNGARNFSSKNYRPMIRANKSSVLTSSYIMKEIWSTQFILWYYFQA